MEGDKHHAGMLDCGWCAAGGLWLEYRRAAAGAHVQVRGCAHRDAYSNAHTYTYAHSAHANAHCDAGTTNTPAHTSAISGRASRSRSAASFDELCRPPGLCG